MTPAFLTNRQTAERYNISLSTLYALLKRNEFPQGHRFSGAVRWRLADLEAFDARRSAAQAGAH